MHLRKYKDNQVIYIKNFVVVFEYRGKNKDII